MSDTFAYYNGQWMARSEVSVNLGDRGFYLGDAVFDLFRTFGGRPYRLCDHVERFFRSLKYVRIDPGLTASEVEAIGTECVRRNEDLRGEVGDWSVWFGATRGIGGWRTLDARPTVIVFCAQVPFGSFARFYDSGAHLVTPRTRNHPPETLEPKLKHTSRMHLNLADVEARDVDVDAWPVMLDTAGNLSEGSGSNAFLVSGGTLRTPPGRNVLHGVTRAAVMELASQLGVTVVEEDLQPYDLYTADEVFLSSTPFFVLPITRTDGRTVGDGRPGAVTSQLLAAFGEQVGVDLPEQALRYADAESTI